MNQYFAEFDSGLCRFRILRDTKSCGRRRSVPCNRAIFPCYQRGQIISLVMYDRTRRIVMMHSLYRMEL